MPILNPLARELAFKVVYYGPGLGGKTTSLQHIHATARPEHRGKMVSLATPVDRTLYFDFLPVRVPNVRNMSVRLQLFTVPGQVYYNATRKLVLTGADGVVMVFDSQRARMDANLESQESLRENLRALGKVVEALPTVVQYNKRDLYDIVPLDELERQLNRSGVPSFATVATTGQGVYEALESIIRAVIEDFDRQSPEARGMETASALDLPQGGIADALRRGERSPRSSSVPPAPLPLRRTSGVLRISPPPELDAGEAAARAVTQEGERRPLETPVSPGLRGASTLRPSPTLEIPDPLPPSVPGNIPAAVERATSTNPPSASGLSFEAVWPDAERGTVRELERAFALGDFAHAMMCVDRLVARTLASAGTLLGGTVDAPRDPALAAILLGVDGPRYLEFRALVRDMRAGRGLEPAAVLGAYAMAVQMRLARARAGT